MKKKKINKNENEWKGVLQEKEPFTIRENFNIPDRFKKEFGCDFYQVGESNVTPESFTVTSTNTTGKISMKDGIFSTKGSDYYVDKEYCNVGVSKDWENYQNSKLKYVKSKLFDPNLSSDFTEDQIIKLNKFYHDNWVEENVSYKQERIDFEFTPLTFWQLTPSIALNLSIKEVEFVWMCFGMYINWK